MERVARRLISPALVAFFFCLPVGLGGIVNVWIAVHRLRQGEVEDAVRSINLAKSWIRTSVYVTLGLLLVASVILYLLGPKIIGPMGSFY